MAAGGSLWQPMELFALFSFCPVDSQAVRVCVCVGVCVCT